MPYVPTEVVEAAVQVCIFGESLCWLLALLVDALVVLDVQGAVGVYALVGEVRLGIGLGWLVLGDAAFV